MVSPSYVRWSSLASQAGLDNLNVTACNPRGNGLDEGMQRPSMSSMAGLGTRYVLTRQ
jgi:hypothetical protein